MIRNLALLKTNLSILCEYRTIYKIGQLFFQMKNITKRNELFLTTLFVFCRQDEKFQKIVYEQIINSSCVETLVQVNKQQKHSEILRKMFFFLFIVCIK